MLHRFSLFITFILVFTSFCLQGQNLIINEFLANNESAIVDEVGEHEDWIEIYNTGTADIDMAGMFLTDDLENPNLWQIPTDKPESTTILAGGYLLFWLDKDEEQGPLHTNFKLNTGGEQIGLFYNDSSPIDVLTYTTQSIDISYGRNIEEIDDWQFFEIPTPLAPNTISLAKALPPSFSQSSGSFNESISLSLTAEEADQSIYFTTDGSLPNSTSFLYVTPLSIDSSMTIRAFVAKDNTYSASPAQTEVYLIQENHSFPILFLAFDPKDFFDPTIGIFPNFEEKWEKPVEITFFNKDGTIGFQQPASAKIQGGGGVVFDHKSLALQAKKQGGNKKFDFPLFPELEYDKYGSFILRNSGQDWNVLYFRDAFSSNIVVDLSDLDGIIDKPKIVSQAFRPSIGYFNGAYRGIYNIRERLDKKFFKRHFGWSENDYDLIKDEDELKVGDWEDWDNYMDFIKNDMSIPSNYDSLTKLMDIEAYIDHIVLNLYINNHDWPGNNNRRFKEKSPEGKWTWICYDMDYSFALFNGNNSWNSGDFTDNSLSRLTNGIEYEWPVFEWGTRPFRACIQNPVWRTQFINRMADQLNILFEPARMQARLDKFVALYEPEIAEHFCKWFDCWIDWEENVEKIENFIGGRAGAMRNHMIAQYPEITGTSTISLSASPTKGGNIEFNTINLNQNNYPWSGTYFKGVEIPLSVKAAPGYEFINWSIASLGNKLDTTIILTTDEYSLIANFQKIPTELTAFCPADLHLTTTTGSTTATWPSPTASSNCFNNTYTITQIAGLPSGSSFLTGTHPITYTITDTCENKTNCNFSIVVTDTVVDLTNIHNNKYQLTASPNPFRQQTTISIKGSTFNHAQFLLFDLTGKVLQKSNFKKNTFTLDRKNLVSGTYLIKVIIDQKTTLTRHITVF